MKGVIIPPINIPSTILLWSNPNTSVAFDGQTVSIDLSSYRNVIIEYANCTMLASKNERNTYHTLFDYNTADKFGRGAVVGYAGIVFSNGYKNNAIDNSAMIPYKIYGVK